MLYLIAIGCITPPAPHGGYLAWRQGAQAYFMCCVGHEFPNGQRQLTLNCLQANTWDKTVPECIGKSSASIAVMSINISRCSICMDCFLTPKIYFHVLHDFRFYEKKKIKYLFDVDVLNCSMDFDARLLLNKSWTLTLELLEKFSLNSFNLKMNIVFVFRSILFNRKINTRLNL